eukprot:4720889-Pyramimonas_sp.AAC.1
MQSRARRDATWTKDAFPAGHAGRARARTSSSSASGGPSLRGTRDFSSSDDSAIANSSAAG